MKKKNGIISFLRKFFNAKDFINTAVSFIALVIIISFTILFTNSFNFYSLIDVGTFTAVVSAFILNFISNAVYNAYKKHKEDESKVTTDYDNLVKMYSVSVEMLEYVNFTSCDDNISAGRKKTTCTSKEVEIKGKEYDSYKIPIANIISLKGRKVKFNNDNARTMYKRPSELDSMSGEMMKAHSYSKTYNQLMIRCDAIQVGPAEVELFLSKTTYYDSLVTNRAIDYVVNGTTVRDVFAYGPYLHPLEDSVLSNHIGYNGFIETEDGKIVFIFRNKYVSIAKNTMQSSIGASLKVKYACENNGIVTKNGVVYAIKKEIEDELCLNNMENYEKRKNEIFKDFGFDNILYFYRELTEGGKPQLMFYAKLPLHSEEIKCAYTKGVKRIKKGDFWCAVDGFKMLFVDKADLKKMYISPDGMTVNGKFYKSVPTSTGTLVLLINHLSEMGEI